jgi:hypothetical protein
MVDDDWLEETLGFCWAETGTGLLMQQPGQLRCFAVGPELVETGTVSMDASDLVGFGYAAGDWWLCYTAGQAVVHRRGLDGAETALAGLVPGQVSRPSVSPDGQTLACVVAAQTVAFWALASGERRFGMRIEPEGEAAIFGPPTIEEIRWSADSRYAVIRPGEPMVSLFVVDVAGQRILATLG